MLRKSSFTTPKQANDTGTLRLSKTIIADRKGLLQTALTSQSIDLKQKITCSMQYRP
uniref:Uncharacterized protein n=1 Tax=Arundo donax TaxID=35708 RepID=A0A0A9AZQ6_ARUDO